MEFKNDQLVEIYQKMLVSRYLEEEIEKQEDLKRIYGPTHLAIGQEAAAIGAGVALDEDDITVITHRGHAQAIGAGTNINSLMAEIFGKETGSNGGKSGSINYSDPQNNIYNENGIVGAGFPLACGLALTQKMKNTNKAVLCFGGDGSVNEGNFHEALNLASKWKLPIVFFIENNLYARSTPLEEHLSVDNISDRASSYNMPGITVDGNDALETYGITKLALDYVRKGEGPVLIEAQTYRINPFDSYDQDTYRSEEEILDWIDEDPIPKMADYLRQNNIVNEEELFDMERRARHIVAEAVSFAQSSPEPDVSEYNQNIFK